MNNPKEVVERYIAAWNERDAGRRRAMVAKAWTEDANYTDPHRSGAPEFLSTGARHSRLR